MIKASRKLELLELQKQISLERNQAQVGRILPVLVEGYGEGLTLGRSYRDAPEVDGLVLVPGELPVGEIVPIRIDGAMVHDLSGIPDTTPARMVFKAASLPIVDGPTLGTSPNSPR